MSATTVIGAHPVLSKYPALVELLAIAYNKYRTTDISLSGCISGAYLTWLHTETPTTEARAEVSNAIAVVFPPVKYAPNEVE